MRIVYISTYPPRQCGIATFNDNLIRAIQKNLNAKSFREEFAIALNDADERDTYEYPPNVKFVIRQEKQEDYIEAARMINESDADICIVQHEFGIYGGQSGIFILSLLHRLEKPVVTISAHYFKRALLSSKDHHSRNGPAISKTDRDE